MAGAKGSPYIAPVGHRSRIAMKGTLGFEVVQAGFPGAGIRIGDHGDTFGYGQMRPSVWAHMKLTAGNMP